MASRSGRCGIPLLQLPEASEGKFQNAPSWTYGIMPRSPQLRSSMPSEEGRYGLQELLRIPVVERRIKGKIYPQKKCGAAIAKNSAIIIDLTAVSLKLLSLMPSWRFSKTSKAT